MNEIEAREILGCNEKSSYKELKAAYRRLILIVHPDKAGQDSISQERAREASSRLNGAWEYLERREKAGILGKADEETKDFSTSSRMRSTYPHECDICGYAPAIRISAPIISSFLYFFRRGKYDLNACRSCGLAMSRLALRETLIKGWWGLGLFFMPHAIYRYFQNVSNLSRIDFPKFRDPDVITLNQYPFKVPDSPFKQPAPMAATAIALLLIGYFFIGGASSSSISQTTPDYYFGQVGSCYEEVSSVGGDKVQLVDCGSSNATLTSVEEVNSPYLCPDTSIYTTVAKLPDGTTRTACLSYNY